MTIMVLVRYDDDIMVDRSKIVKHESQIKAFPICVLKGGKFSCIEVNMKKVLFHHTPSLLNGHKTESDSSTSEENDDIFLPESKELDECSVAKLETSSCPSQNVETS